MKTYSKALYSYKFMLIDKICHAFYVLGRVRAADLYGEPVDFNQEHL